MPILWQVIYWLNIERSVIFNFLGKAAWAMQKKNFLIFLIWQKSLAFNLMFLDSFWVPWFWLISLILFQLCFSFTHVNKNRIYLFSVPFEILLIPKRQVHLDRWTQVHILACDNRNISWWQCHPKVFSWKKKSYNTLFLTLVTSIFKKRFTILLLP